MRQIGRPIWMRAAGIYARGFLRRTASSGETGSSVRDVNYAASKRSMVSMQSHARTRASTSGFCAIEHSLRGGGSTVEVLLVSSFDHVPLALTRNTPAG